MNPTTSCYLEYFDVVAIFNAVLARRKFVYGIASGKIKFAMHRIELVYFSEAKNQLPLDGWRHCCWYHGGVRSRRCVFILFLVILVFGILVCFFFRLASGQS